jgi:hypothetical protein
MRLLPARLVAAGLLAAASLFATSASAQFRVARDYFLNPPRAGLVAIADAYTLGFQGALERRLHLEEGMSMLTLRASGIASAPYAEGAVHGDIRLLFLSIGGSAGYRYDWRHIRFSDDEPMDRDARSAYEDADRITTQGFGFAEGRARLAIPLQRFLLLTEAAVRFENRPDNSFDWPYSTVYDGGTLYRGEATFFVRDPALGAIGPYGRVLDLPGRDDPEFGFGFAGGIRPGILGSRDLMLLRLVFSPTDELFGNTYGPLHALFLYRVELKL